MIAQEMILLARKNHTSGAARNVVAVRLVQRHQHRLLPLLQLGSVRT